MSHKFTIYIDRSIYEENKMRDLLRLCHQLPTVGIGRLQFVLKGLRRFQNHGISDWHLKAVLGDRNEVTWSRWVTSEQRLPLSSIFSPASEDDAVKMFCFGALAKAKGFSQVSGGKVPSLNIGVCANVLCEFLGMGKGGQGAWWRFANVHSERNT